MIRCTFRLNGQGLSTLSCPGIGFFPAYSGNAGATRNNAEFMDVPDIGPLPPGRYYIVARPTTGTTLAKAKDRTVSYASGSDRLFWFGLFKDDASIDDNTFINTVARGAFRLHPAGDKGISEGCITVVSKSQYAILYRALRETATMRVTPSLLAFGTVQVY